MIFQLDGRHVLAVLSGMNKTAITEEFTDLDRSTEFPRTLCIRVKASERGCGLSIINSLLEVLYVPINNDSYHSFESSYSLLKRI